ncbi:MAG: hypothetical protein QNJ78_14325 [Gammaproteobacteria bacterium]|nr:hypothetical protein [Gammaproteobacteria bacterium]
MSTLMTFVGGALVGTLVTYLAKNEEARKTTERFVDAVGAAFTDYLHRVTPHSEKQEIEPDPEPPSDAPEKPTQARKQPRGSRSVKTKKTATTESSVH